MPRPRTSIAAQARALAAAGITVPAIAARLHRPPRFVRLALKRGQKPIGRKPLDGYGPRVYVRLPLAVDAAVRAEAARDGLPIAEVIASAVAASVLPESEWLGHSAKSQMLRRVYVKIPSSTHAREGAKLPSRRGKTGGGEKST